MTTLHHCPRCGTRIEEATSPEGLCPACLMQQALEEFPSTDGDEQQATETARTSDAASPSRSIGPYRLLQKLGEGGMGEVWAAEQQEPVRRKVAIKLIKAGMDTKQVIARFESERQALALMDHPSIARVFDAGATDEGRPYFAMELVRGVPITEHCDRHRLSTEDRLRLFMQVCEGVQHAHQKGIIHRDLKPSNVLVTIDGEKATPKIIDFGVAKATEQRLTEKTMFTELGVLIGTPEYMSPEQADLTAQDIDTRTDVYSLGVLLYQLLAGALPFDSNELRKACYDEIRRRIREDDPPKPSTRLSTLGGEIDAAKARRTDLSSLRRQLQGDLDWISMKALEKDRTRRYGSPNEFAADVRRHLRHEPVLAGPPSATYRARKFVRRHRTWVGFAAVLVVVLIGIAVTMTIQAGRIARERDRANDEADRANREAETANRVSEFMVRLFEIPDPGEARGNSITARELLDRGSQDIKQGLREEPSTRARLMTTMGKTYHGLGVLDRAEKMLTEALAVRREHGLPEDESHADNLCRLGWLRFDMRDLESLEELIEPCLAMQRANLPASEPELAYWLSGTAVLRGGQGRLAEAESRLRESLSIWRRRADAPDWRRHHAYLTAMMQAVGNQRHDEARVWITKVLEEFSSLEKAGAYIPLMHTPLNEVGIALMMIGEYDRARRFLEQGLAWVRGLTSTESPLTMPYLTNLASAMYHSDEFEGGLAQARQCLAVGRTAVHRRTRTAKCELLLAYGLLRTGEVDLARVHYEQSLTVLEETLGWRSPWNTPHYHSLGRLLIEAEDFANAARVYELVLTMLSRDGHTPGLDESTVRAEYTELLRRMGRNEEAEEQEVRAAELAEQATP